MTIILGLGGGLGWVVNRANVQRDAVAAIEQAGGKVAYEWELTPISFIYGRSFQPNPAGAPRWPRWLVEWLGPDYFGDVKKVVLGPQSTDAVMPYVARLGELEDLDAPGGSRLTNVGLVHLRGLTKLRSFGLGPSPGVTGAAFLNVAELTQLERLGLYKSATVVDEDLAHLRKLVNLRMLRLDGGGEGITDAGMTHLSGLTQLRELVLLRSRITGIGLTCLNQMKDLDDLMIVQSRVETLEPLRDMKKLRILFVSGSPLDDAGLRHGEHLTSLRHLMIADTLATDEGLESLVNVASLRELNVKGTKVTAGGAAAFLKARPEVTLIR
jgi:hypothetical protein